MKPTKIDCCCVSDPECPVHGFYPVPPASEASEPESRDEDRQRIRKIKTATCEGCLAAALGLPLHTVAESGYAARSYCGDAWEAGWEYINGSATWQQHLIDNAAPPPSEPAPAAEPTKRITSVVPELLAILDDPEATEDEKDAAAATIVEAVAPDIMQKAYGEQTWDKPPASEPADLDEYNPDYYACFTGDCPHDKASDCLLSVQTEAEVTFKALRQERQQVEVYRKRMAKAEANCAAYKSIAVKMAAFCARLSGIDDVPVDVYKRGMELCHEFKEVERKCQSQT